MENYIGIAVVAVVVGFIVWRIKSKKKATGSGGSSVGGGSNTRTKLK